MNSIDTISSIHPTPAASARFATSEESFQMMLNEVLRTSNLKEVQVNQARKDQPEATPSFEQSSPSSHQMNATISALTHLSPSMLSLYKDQESKSERLGRSRAVIAASHA